MYIYICWVLLLLSSGSLIYQDFKSRLVSVWLIILFTISNICLYLNFNSLNQLFENVIFCLAYFLLCYLCLHVYFFLKLNKFQKLLDSKLGWGDILLLFSIGSCLEIDTMIIFFTITFIFTVITHYMMFKSSNSIPLAGYLLICYHINLILFRDIFGFNLLERCHF
jgi:hypothetical protein